MNKKDAIKRLKLLTEYVESGIAKGEKINPNVTGEIGQLADALRRTNAMTDEQQQAIVKKYL